MWLSRLSTMNLDLLCHSENIMDISFYLYIVSRNEPKYIFILMQDYTELINFRKLLNSLKVLPRENLIFNIITAEMNEYP